jgi:hypothetical protein
MGANVRSQYFYKGFSAQFLMGLKCGTDEGKEQKLEREIKIKIINALSHKRKREAADLVI